MILRKHSGFANRADGRSRYMNKAPVKDVSHEDVLELPLSDGTMYSKTNGIRPDQSPFSLSTLEQYLPIVGEEKIERLTAAAEKLKGIKMMKTSPPKTMKVTRQPHMIMNC